MLQESECWKVSGVRTAEKFFRAVLLLVPDATHQRVHIGPGHRRIGGIRFECQRRSCCVCRSLPLTMPNRRSAIISTFIETETLWCNGSTPSQIRFSFRRWCHAHEWSSSRRPLALTYQTVLPGTPADADRLFCRRVVRTGGGPPAVKRELDKRTQRIEATLQS
jgi:hypothetical protein